IRIEAAEGVDVREAVFHRAVENRWTMRELAGETATLEDVFVRLTTRDHAEAPGDAAAAKSGEASA
ncbi:MAG TPA: hypothetical protein VG777_08555, partial [Thermoanaerobaculia bacterium]|nr:hypothetical protein [Thermoanaerobaculia bacterium]